MHAVKKRGGSALLLTRCCMKRKTEYKILNQKTAEKKVCKEFTSHFGVGFTTNTKRTQYGQNNVSFVIGVSKENSIMGTELETLPFLLEVGKRKSQQRRS